MNFVILFKKKLTFYFEFHSVLFDKFVQLILLYFTNNSYILIEIIFEKWSQTERQVQISHHTVFISWNFAVDHCHLVFESRNIYHISLLSIKLDKIRTPNNLNFQSPTLSYNLGREYHHIVGTLQNCNHRPL